MYPKQIKHPIFLIKSRYMIYSNTNFTNSIVDVIDIPNTCKSSCISPLFALMYYTNSTYIYASLFNNQKVWLFVFVMVVWLGIWSNMYMDTEMHLSGLNMYCLGVSGHHCIFIWGFSPYTYSFWTNDFEKFLASFISLLLQGHERWVFRSTYEKVKLMLGCRYIYN